MFLRSDRHFCRIFTYFSLNFFLRFLSTFARVAKRGSEHIPSELDDDFFFRPFPFLFRFLSLDPAEDSSDDGEV